MFNGLLLSATMHQCFDTRILLIDRDTGRIRAFMPYDLITDYYGKKANLPRGIDRRALRHHYDMCCMENMAAKKQPGLGLFTVVRNKAIVISPVTPMALNLVDPTKENRTPGDEQNQDSGSSGTNQNRSEVQQRWGGHLPTPPSSDSGQKRTWRLGQQRLTDPQKVQRLREEGWVLYEDDGRSNDQSSEEEERGRSRKRRCIFINSE